MREEIWSGVVRKSRKCIKEGFDISGIDLDPKWWPLNQWFVTPSDIYGDNNTVMKISYLGIE